MRPLDPIRTPAARPPTAPHRISGQAGRAKPGGEPRPPGVNGATALTSAATTAAPIFRTSPPLYRFHHEAESA